METRSLLSKTTKLNYISIFENLAGTDTAMGGMSFRHNRTNHGWPPNCWAVRRMDHYYWTQP